MSRTAASRVVDFRFVLLSLTWLLCACERDSASFEFTIPANGSTNVNGRTIIAIRLTNTMTSSDESNNLDTRNITVVGDQTFGVYGGQIQATQESQVFPGQTVDEFRAGINSIAERDDEVGIPEPPIEDDTGNDVLVWLLEGSTAFKPGEVVTVTLSDDIAVRGVKFKGPKVFKFTVAGGGDRAEGEFFVTSTFPAAEDARVAPRPEISASFTQNVALSSLDGNVVVRGEWSGFHSGGSVQASGRDATRTLDAEDYLRPGETVEVTWTSEVKATSADGGADLSPYTIRFQARPGLNSGGWSNVTLESLASPVVAVVPGEFSPGLKGVELAVVTESEVAIYRQTEGGVWTKTIAPIAVGFRAVGAVAVDPDDDGKPQLVVLLSSGSTSRLQEYRVDGDGVVAAKGTAFDFAAPSPRGFSAADLDSDGQSELLLLHDETTYVPTILGEPIPGATEESTGFVTFFELVMGLPANVDLGDVENLLEVQYLPVRRPIANFPSGSRLEARDLDNDGRQDLALEAADGLVLWRNQSTSENPLTFRRAGALPGRPGDPARPENWVIVDIDGDRDADILTWKGSTALLSRNRIGSLEVPGGLLFDTSPPVEFPELGVVVGNGDRVLAANIDGDDGGRVDLLVARPEGLVELVTRDVAGIWSTRQLAGSGALAAFDVSDLNGDTGMDIVAVRSGRLDVLLTSEDDVTAPAVPQPSDFTFVDVSSEEELAAGELALEVHASITRRFSGFSIALDYDQAVLQYIGFTPPSSLANRATFSPCPDASGVGCAGFASVRMEYQQNGVGAPSPSWVLGVFRFRARTVEEPTDTEVVFTEFTSGGATFSNTLRVSEGGPAQDVAIRTGSPFELTVQPPPPPPLEIDCVVDRRLERSLLVRIAWGAELERYDRVEVSIGDDGEGGSEVFPWEQASATIDVSLGGVVPITVTATRDGAGGSVASETCEVVNVFRPEIISCEFDGEANLVTWTHEQDDVEFFHVYRNGSRVLRLPRPDQSTFTYRDVNFSPEGGDLYEVSALIAGVESGRASCRGRDPQPCITADPIEDLAQLDRRTRAVDPNVVRFRWRNGEAYDRLVARLEFVSTDNEVEDLFGPEGRSLDPAQEELVWSADLDRGGAVPGSYTLRLQAFNTRPGDGSCPGGGEQIPSAEIQFSTVVVPVPTLGDVSMQCQVSGVNDILVTWLSPWKGYDEFLSLRVVQTVDGEEIPIGEGDPSFDQILLSDNVFYVRGIEPVGSYEVRLLATFGDRVLETSCRDLDFTPRVFVSDVDAPIGSGEFDIPIRASSVFSVVEGFAFDLDFPEQVTIAGYEDAPVVGGRKRITVVADGVAIDPDPDGDLVTDGEVVLVRLQASVPEDFELARLSPQALDVENATLRFLGNVSDRVAQTASGTIRFVGRYVILDQTEMVAGTGEEVVISARVTFTAPDGFPDYKFQAFSLQVRFDPEHLELLPVTRAEQVGVVVDTGRYFLPGNEVARSNEIGLVQVGWFGTLGQPLQFLRPVTDARLLNLRFRTRLPASTPEVFSPISFVVTPDDFPDGLTQDELDRFQLTSFIPLEDVPGVSDVDAHVAGGVRIRPSTSPVSLGALEPARGPLTGGNTVRVLGRGLDGGDGSRPTIELVAPNGRVIPVDPTTIQVVSGDEVRFLAPDSLPLPADSGATRRPLPPTTSVVHEVRLTTSAGVLIRRPGGYRYDTPRVTQTDVRSVRAGYPDKVKVSGLGLSDLTRVAFVVGSNRYPATVFRAASDDGTSIVIEAPLDLPSPPAGVESIQSTLEVTVDDIGDFEPLSILTLRDPIEILPSDGEIPELAVTDIIPAAGLNCSEEVITISGTGFTPVTEVLFDVVGGPLRGQILDVSSRELEVRLPYTSDAGVVEVIVRDRGREVTPRPTFRFDSPAPFIRGDTDESGGLSITDATFLLQLLFGGSDLFPTNRDSLDANDDGAVNLGDSVRILRFLFQGDDPLPAPYPEPGQDPTRDDICQ